MHDRHEVHQTHYSARRGALAPLVDWTSRMAGFWQSWFDDLEDLLKRMDQWATALVLERKFSQSASPERTSSAS